MISILVVLFFTQILSASISSSSSIGDVTIEAQYIKHFGNDPHRYDTWMPIKDWYWERFQPNLKLFCAAAHKQAGKGEVVVDIVIVTPRTLTFQNASYLPRKVDVVEYGIGLPPRDAQNTHYITAGGRDCVYYVRVMDQVLMNVILVQQVCGVNMTEIKPNTTKKPKTTTTESEDSLERYKGFAG